MRRFLLVLIVAVLATAVIPLHADVRTDQRTKFQLAGALGKVVGMFGGKAAKEGAVSSIALKGDRKATMGEATGQIVDLAEEKVYDLDLKKKTYTVTTFAELRRRLEEAKKKAEEDAKKEQAADQPAERDPNAKEYEVDFDVKNTGEAKTINGFDTKQSVVTITVREKGKTLEEGGGMVMTSDMWLTPRVAALKELQEFDQKYFEKVYGAVVAGASPQDMAAAMAMYPQMKPALDKMRAEGSKVEGTPILTTVTMDGVKSAEQLAAEQKGEGGSESPKSIGGLLGGFAKKAAKKGDAPKARATVLTTSVEVLKLTTDVDAAAVAVPAGFKESK